MGNIENIFLFLFCFFCCFFCGKIQQAKYFIVDVWQSPKYPSSVEVKVRTISVKYTWCVCRENTQIRTIFSKSTKKNILHAIHIMFI